MSALSIIRFLSTCKKKYILDNIFLIPTTQWKLSDNTMKLKRKSRRKMWSLATVSLCLLNF